MKAARRNGLTKFALVAGLAAHLLLPMAMAAAPAAFDAASLFCAPGGQVSPEAKAAIAEMLRLAGEDAPGEPDTSAAKHCGACMLAACAPPHASGLLVSIEFTAERHLTPRGRDNAHATVHGPPLGLRAPPASLTAI